MCLGFELPFFFCFSFVAVAVTVAVAVAAKYLSNFPTNRSFSTKFTALSKLKVVVSCVVPKFDIGMTAFCVLCSIYLYGLYFPAAKNFKFTSRSSVRSDKSHKL